MTIHNLSALLGKNRVTTSVTESGTMSEKLQVPKYTNYRQFVDCEDPNTAEGSITVPTPPTVDPVAPSVNPPQVPMTVIASMLPCEEGHYPCPALVLRDNDAPNLGQDSEGKDKLMWEDGDTIYHKDEDGNPKAVEKQVIPIKIYEGKRDGSQEAVLGQLVLDFEVQEQCCCEAEVDAETGEREPDKVTIQPRFNFIPGNFPRWVSVVGTYTDGECMNAPGVPPSILIEESLGFPYHGIFPLEFINQAANRRAWECGDFIPGMMDTHSEYPYKVYSGYFFECAEEGGCCAEIETYGGVLAALKGFGKHEGKTVWAGTLSAGSPRVDRMIFTAVCRDVVAVDNPHEDYRETPWIKLPTNMTGGDEDVSWVSDDIYMVGLPGESGTVIYNKRHYGKILTREKDDTELNTYAYPLYQYSIDNRMVYEASNTTNGRTGYAGGMETNTEGELGYQVLPSTYIYYDGLYWGQGTGTLHLSETQTRGESLSGLGYTAWEKPGWRWNESKQVYTSIDDRVDGEHYFGMPRWLAYTQNNNKYREGYFTRTVAEPRGGIYLWSYVGELRVAVKNNLGEEADLVYAEIVSMYPDDSLLFAEAWRIGSEDSADGYYSTSGEPAKGRTLTFEFHGVDKRDPKMTTVSAVLDQTAPEILYFDSKYSIPNPESITGRWQLVDGTDTKLKFVPNPPPIPETITVTFEALFTDVIPMTSTEDETQLQMLHLEFAPQFSLIVARTTTEEERDMDLEVWYQLPNESTVVTFERLADEMNEDGTYDTLEEEIKLYSLLEDIYANENEKYKLRYSVEYNTWWITLDDQGWSLKEGEAERTKTLTKRTKTAEHETTIVRELHEVLEKVDNPDAKPAERYPVFSDKLNRWVLGTPWQFGDAAPITWSWVLSEVDADRDLIFEYELPERAAIKLEFDKLVVTEAETTVYIIQPAIHT